MAEATTPHETSLAVWDTPATVVAGERFAVKVGAKSSAGCALAGGRIAVAGADGIATGRLGDAPWPGTAALFFVEVERRAPVEPGPCQFSVRFDAAGLGEPHRGAQANFSTMVVAKPEHTLTVRVVAGEAPIETAQIRLGPYRATTDGDGVAEVKLAKGRYALVVWKAGYDTPSTPLDIAADARVQVEAIAQPEENPDARWTA
jgi:hypothetical protein